jgi:uncharacterized protein
MNMAEDATLVREQRLAGGIPTPTLHEWNTPFFAGGTLGKLVLQRCLRCHELIYYPRMVCPKCLSPDYEWATLSGLGTVYSFSIVWRPNHPAFADQIPITLAVVDLDEGPQMVTTIIGCPGENVSIGMKVKVVFDAIAEGIALPKFTPVS